MKRLEGLRGHGVLSLTLIAVFSLLTVAAIKWNSVATATLDNSSLPSSETASTSSNAQSYIAPLDLGLGQTYREYQDVGVVLNWGAGRKA